MYDYLIVGSGLYGSIFAHELFKNGAKCLVLEKRSHIGGNCYTREHQNIHIHEYGPHIFHTNNKKIWNYINNFSEFNSFVYRPKVYYKNKLYSFPLNLMTFYQLWGTKTPSEVEQKLKEVKIKIDHPKNLEEWILSQVGEEIYQTFVYGYTKKQWNRHPNDLPASIIKRLPIRLSFDDNYFDDRYQGIPIGGYTNIFNKMLSNIPIECGVNYLQDMDYWNKKASKVVYTGPLDEFFNYDCGELEWRSLKFEHEYHDCADYQGVAAINYTDENVPYTRICEHKHFEFGKQNHTVITKEFSQNWDKTKEKYYPINDEKNNELCKLYKSKIPSNYIFGGRLADYKYYDMHQVVGSALADVEKEIKQTI